MLKGIYMTPRKLAITPIVLSLLMAGAAHGIEIGILDDFESGTTDNWEEGNISSNPPMVTAGCGVSGSNCMSNVSSGGGGPGSRQVTYNREQWTGDYGAAGVTQVRMQLSNGSASESLFVRIGITDGTTCYVSTSAVVIPAGTPTLQQETFSLDPADMSEVGGNSCGVGGGSFATVLANVTELRIISSELPDWRGDAAENLINVDEIESLGAAADEDMDGVSDDSDNCTLVANPSQQDTDMDGFGNACDGDLDNDCQINFSDLAIMKGEFFASGDLVSDLDGDGTTNFSDLALLKAAFFGEPGPGLGNCDS